jgi:glycosyltransferase involved in cell wall biosynthesis
MLDKKNNFKNVVYLHGRPSAHTLHSTLAKAITDNFQFVDAPIRWQDKKRGFFLDALSWVFNALFFKNKKKYDAFLLDNLHVTPIIMRKLGLIKKNQKLIVHLGSHTLFFMYSRKFNKLNNSLHKYALRNYDALICEGEMAEELTRGMLAEKSPPIYQAFVAPLETRNRMLQKCNPDLSSNKILIIAGGPAEFRMYYKGLDLMIMGFELAHIINNKIELIIIGHWSDEVIDFCLKNINMETKKAISFKGIITDSKLYVTDYIEKSALCLQCARGDAFPVSSIEAMAAGLPTIVSEWTGTKQIVKNVSKNLIANLSANNIAEKIGWYFGLPLDERKRLSLAAKKATENYTEEAATEKYKNIFVQIFSDIV